MTDTKRQETTVWLDATPLDAYRVMIDNVHNGGSEFRDLVTPAHVTNLTFAMADCSQLHQVFHDTLAERLVDFYSLAEGTPPSGEDLLFMARYHGEDLGPGMTAEVLETILAALTHDDRAYLVFMEALRGAIILNAQTNHGPRKRS